MTGLKPAVLGGRPSLFPSGAMTGVGSMAADDTKVWGRLNGGGGDISEGA